MNKMQFGLIFAGLLLVGLVLGCTSSEQTPVCNVPYILVGTGCCLDQNDNSICDTDESAQTAASGTPATNALSEIPESTTPALSAYAVFGNCSVLTDEDITNAMGVTMAAGEPFLGQGRTCSKDWSSSDYSSAFRLYVNDREDGKTGDVLKGECGAYHEIEQIGDYCTSTSTDRDSSDLNIYFGKGTYVFTVGCSGTSCDTALLIKVANLVVSRV